MLQHFLDYGFDCAGIFANTIISADTAESDFAESDFASSQLRSFLIFRWHPGFRHVFDNRPLIVFEGTFPVVNLKMKCYNIFLFLRRVRFPFLPCGFLHYSQGSCSTSGSLCEMPDSNPGPLPQKSGFCYTKIRISANWKPYSKCFS